MGYTYDGSGRLWKVTDAAGGVTEYTYDTSDRMLTITDPRGILFLTNQYDSNGRVVEQTLADGQEGLAYVSDCLGSGGELSGALLHTLDLGRGTLLTLLPVDVSSSEVNKFFDGGKLTCQTAENLVLEDSKGENDSPRLVPIPNLDECVVDIVLRHLSSGSTAYTLFEDAVARPGDPWLSSAGTRVVLSRYSVFHLALPSDSRQKISTTVRVAKSIYPPLMAALARMPNETQHWASGAIINAESLVDVALRTESIVLGAYDGEGFLIWSKT